MGVFSPGIIFAEITGRELADDRTFRYKLFLAMDKAEVHANVR
jgi:hypothetical protein